MFTPGKIILTVILVLIGWYAFKFFRRVNEVAKMAKAMAERQYPGDFRPETGKDLVEMKACSVCGTYSSSRCERKDCPL